MSHPRIPENFPKMKIRGRCRAAKTMPPGALPMLLVDDNGIAHDLGYWDTDLGEAYVRPSKRAFSRKWVRA